jgi:hypothetical protein
MKKVLKQRYHINSTESRTEYLCKALQWICDPNIDIDTKETLSETIKDVIARIESKTFRIGPDLIFQEYEARKTQVEQFLLELLSVDVKKLTKDQLIGMFMAIYQIIDSFRDITMIHNFCTSFYSIYLKLVMEVTQSIGSFLMDSTKNNQVSSKDTLLGSHVLKYLSKTVNIFLEVQFKLKSFANLAKLANDEHLLQLISALYIITCNVESGQIFSITGEEDVDNNLNSMKKNVIQCFAVFIRNMASNIPIKDWEKYKVFEVLFQNC